MPIAGRLLELEHDAPPGPGVPLGIGDLHGLLEQVAIATAANRLQGTDRFDAQARVMADDEGRLTPGDGGQEGGHAKVPIGDPQVVRLNRLGDLIEQAALLGMTIGAGEHVTEQPPRIIEDHQRLAGQRRGGTVAQGFEPSLAGGHTVAVQVADAIARQALGAGAAELVDDLRRITGDQTHQSLGGRQLDPLELVIDRHDRGGDARLAMGHMHIGLYPTDNLQHQPDQRGEQDLARVLLFARHLEPAVKAFGVEQALE